MITLASDFGWPYPAAMKGAILQRTEAQLVDITHDFPRQDIRTAGFWLRELLPYFPPAVHLIVVDPGVGTDRAGLVIRSGDHALVGPDNGVMLPAARRLASDRPIEPFEIDSQRFDTVSETFHGRDIFAPTAADVHEIGIDSLDGLDTLSPAGSIVDLSFPSATVEPSGARGEVLVIDGFGNIVSNIPGEVLRSKFGSTVLVDGVAVPVGRSYARFPAGEPLATIGSHGNLELAVNRGRADERFEYSVGDRIEVTWDRD